MATILAVTIVFLACCGLRLLGWLVVLAWEELEPRLYVYLHCRALDRALNKPYGTMAMRRKLDQRDAA